MAFHHVRARSRAPSSGSISSSSSESPPSVPVFDFTLYGCPAPRSAHRTSSGASKPKPRRRSAKPMPAPPASPQIPYCTEEFQLDFSFLAGDEEELIVTNKASEMYCGKHDIVFKEPSNQSRETTKQNQVEKKYSVKSNGKGDNQNSNSEAIETDDLESAGKAIRLLDSEKDSEDELQSENQSSSTNADSSTMESQYSERGRISSEIISSNQSFGDEGSGSTRSCLSGRSSCISLSEYSADSCSSSSSLKSRKSHQHEILSDVSITSTETSGDLSNKIGEKNNKVEYRNVDLAVGSSIQGNDIQQITRSFPEENLSRNPENSMQVETSNQKSSGVIKNSNMVTELQVAPFCGSKDSACASDPFSVSIEGRSEETHNFVTSSTCDNAKGISTTSIESLTDQCVQESERKRELNNLISYVNFENKFIASDKTSDDVDNDHTKSKSSTNYDHSFLNKVNEIQIKGRAIEEERKAEHPCLCSGAGNSKICGCLSNSFLLRESDIRSSYNSAFCDTNARCSGRKGYFDENPGEYVAGVDIISQDKFPAPVQSEPGSSGLKNPPSARNYVSLINSLNDEDYDEKSNSCNENCQVLNGNYQMPKQDFYSSPTRSHTPNTVESVSVMTCDCESGRTSRCLLECLDSRYFPDISFPAGEVMEAVICARQLVCVLERALDRTLSWNTKETNTDSSLGKSSSNFPTDSTRRKQRSNLSSPNALGVCKEGDSACSSATIELRLVGKHSVLDNGSATGKKEGVNQKEICDTKPQVSRDGVRRRRSSCSVAPPLLIVSAEELRKQRALLKPVADRGVHGSVAQVVDMADVLRSTISRRRKFLDPTDEFICGNNRSDSECSFENACYQDSDFISL